MLLAAPLALIPSPTVAAIHLGPIKIQIYAICILAGVVLAIWLSGKRLVARGGAPGQILDLAVWAVPFGLIGGRLYHIFTTPEPYFGKNGHLIDIFKVWNGGLGIWGAIALGAVGAYIGARQAGLRMSVVADSMAPGIIFAQGIGRIGNYFNNELYGAMTNVPWKLEIYEYDFTEGRAITDAAGNPIVKGYFQPTFLYELIWNVAVGFVLLWADKKFKLGRGRVFALYVALYCLGRFFVEQMRTDTAEIVLGQRLNVWTAILVGLAGLVMFFVRKGPRETSAYVDGREPIEDVADGESSEPTTEGEAIEGAGASERVERSRPRRHPDDEADGNSSH